MIGTVLKLIKSGAKQELAAPGQIVSMVVFLVLILTVFSFLWKAAVGTGQMRGYDGAPELLVWYILLTELVLMATPDVHRVIQDDVASGRFQAMLTKPLPYIVFPLAQGFGGLVVRWLTIGIPGAVTAYALTGTMPDSSAGLAAGFALSLAGASSYLVLMACIGTCSRWIGDTTPLYWVVSKIGFVFGGLLVPLTLYPLWLQKISFWTPFAPILFGSARPVWHFDLAREVITSLQQLGWMCVLTILLILIQRRVLLSFFRGDT